MGRAYKNFWSLNTDEAVVTGILRDVLKKDIEVFMPLNAQMKGIDLLLANTKNKKNISIQVKGSKAFEPSKKDCEQFGDGSTGWFFLKKDTILNATSDYFVFLVYVVEQSLKTGRRYIEPHTITIPTKHLQSLAKKFKKLYTGSYSYYFRVNLVKKEAFEIRDQKHDVSDYLDEKGFEKLNLTLS